MHDPKPPEMHAFSLVSLSLKHRKKLLIIGLATIAMSYLFTSPFFITPLYKSTVILYPTSTNSISKVLLNNNLPSNKDLLEFGEDEQTERMLQILNSNKIRDRIIEKYNLFEHYNIPAGSRYRFTRLYDTYESRVRFRRTEYMAVKITVLDQDPLKASDIANDIAELFDSTMNMMQKEVAVRAFRIVENEYFNLRNQVREMEDSLNTIRKLGVHDYESQAEMINQQLAIEIARNNQPGIKALYDKLELLSKYGGIYVSLRDMLEHERKQLSQIKARYEEAKVDATENLPHKFVVTNAFPAERKSYPIRWLVALIALFSTLFLALLILILVEQSKWSEKKNFNAISHQLNQLSRRIRHTLKTFKPAKPEKIEKSNQHNLSNMENSFNNTSLVRLVYRWRLHLAIITIAAALLGAVFSGPYFITPLYRSEAVAYPANINSYSDESETEQMLQILQSQDITDSMIARFNLMEVYKISPQNKYWRSALLEEFRQNVKVRKTPYEAISITVRDRDPERAADMANEMLRLYDQKVSNLHKTKYKEVVDMYDMQLAKKQLVIDSLQNRLYQLATEHGLIDYGAQSNEVMRGYLRTIYGTTTANINTKAVEQLKKSIENHGGELITVTQMLVEESRTYVTIKLDYEQALRFYNANLTYSNVISKPFPSDKKVFPVRWVIVAFAALGALLISVLVIMLAERKKDLLGIRH